MNRARKFRIGDWVMFKDVPMDVGLVSKSSGSRTSVNWLSGSDTVLPDVPSVEMTERLEKISNSIAKMCVVDHHYYGSMLKNNR